MIKTINPRGTNHTMLDHAPSKDEKAYRDWKDIWDYIDASGNPDITYWGDDDTLETIAKRCADIRIRDANKKHGE